jgi:uncharacterized alkaline shock family protein YloU
LRIVAFIGASGSGKSYSAMWVAKRNDIDFIIDDGLFIKGNRVVAGFSAKKESTKLASVRRALFLDPDHRQQVKDAIGEEKPSAILILGTSLGMVEAIAKALNLPPISKIIRIEDVVDREDIEKARKMRKTEGKHVIPVPTFEIKKDFSGYFLHPLKIFKKKHQGDAPFIADKSVVRPAFSYMGDYTISDQVILTICKHEASSIHDVVKVNKIQIEDSFSGVIINMEVTLVYGVILHQVARVVQSTVKNAVEKYTAVNVLAVNVTVKTLAI